MDRARRISAVRNACDPLCESLEHRTLLCTTHLSSLPPAPQWSDAIEQQYHGATEGGPEAVSIVWTNRNTFSGTDDNFFDDVFGTSAGSAQAVVDAALAAWSRVITSFNRGDGTSTLQISITMAKDGMGNFATGFGGAGAPSSTAPADGKPRTGSIVVNSGTLSPDPNDNNGWFLDPTPSDNMEFQGNILSPFAADQTTSMGSDLYSLISAEVTHCLGLISPKPGTSAFSGYRLETSGFTHFTGQADNAEGGGNKGFFYTFDGPTIDHLMTSYNSGDTDADSWGNVIHTAGGTGNISFNAQNWRGTDDEGNAIYANERSLPSHVTATILKDAYGYSIDPPAKFGSMYAVLDQVTGILNVRGADSSNDSISITRNGSLLTVAVDLQTDVPGSYNFSGAGNAPAWTTEFNLAGITQINVFPRTGNDTVLVSADMGNIPVLVNDTGASDKLQITGGAGYDSFATPGYGSINTTNGSIAYTSMDTLEIYTGDGDADVNLRFTGSSSARITGGPGAQTISFSFLDSGTPTIVDLGDGSDVLNFGTGAGVNPMESPVTIFGGVGDDVINLAPVNSGTTVITQPVTVFGDTGNDTLVLGSNNADSVDVNITYDGGTHAGPTGDRVVINDQGVPYNVSYNVANAVVTRDGFSVPHTINHSNTEGIVINAGSGADTVTIANGLSPTLNAFGNNGNDNYIVGGGNLTGIQPQDFDGGNGIDQITFDNHLDATNRIWDMRNYEVIFGGLISLFTTSFESVGVLGGSGQDEFDFKGLLDQQFQVDGGPNTDTFVLGYQGPVTFDNSVTLLGGDGGDVFTVNDAVINSFAAPLVMDGGNDFGNAMYVNEPLATGYYLGPGYFIPRIGNFNMGTFTFANILTSVVTGTAESNDFTIYSAGVTLGTFTINGGSGDDSFVLAPQLSGYSYNNLTINGQPGTDTFSLNAGALNTNENYTIGTNSLTIARGGVIFETVNISSMNSVNVTCGFGNDTISMNQYSAGIPVTVNGGIGNDTMNIGGGNLAANITSISAFSFNGDNGLDTFNVSNTGDSNQWTYTAQGTSIRSERVAGAPSYIFVADETGVEQLNVNAGGGIDVMNINAVPIGQTLSFSGGNGVDAINLPVSLSTILGPIYFDGGAGSNNINQLNNTSTLPATLHVDQTSVGAFPGDSFFPAGASLRFANVANMVLTMGSGADSVFVQPNVNATINVRGGSPTTAPGDTLNLALANAPGYVLNGTAASGSVTSSLKTLSYSGFETGPNIDAVAPAAVGFDLDLGGGAGRTTPQSISAFFDDAVLGVTPASLSLLNTTTGQTVPASDIAVSANFDTFTFTFPNYPGGILPDGAYQAQILGAGITDLFGNAVSGNSAIEAFVWSAGTTGNDVYRAIRDAGALNYLIYLNDDITPAFVSPVLTTSRIVLAGDDGDDLLTVDFSNGNFGAPLFDLKFYGGAGSDTIGVVGTTAADTASFYDGALQLIGSEINYSGAESVTYDGNGGYDTLAVNDIRVGFANTQRFASLSIGPGAAVELPGSGDNLVIVQALSIAATGVLDLAGGGMVFDYTGSSPLGTIQSLLTTGYALGTWSGLGITSSLAAIASTTSDKTAVGFAEATDLFTTFPAPFAGQQVDDTSVLLRYTLAGDANLDKAVNGADFNILASSFGLGGRRWSSGDFTFDTLTNGADFNVLAGNFGKTLSGVDESARGGDSPTYGGSGDSEGSAGGSIFAGGGSIGDDDEQSPVV